MGTKSRLARVEEAQKQHAEIHRLEAEELALAHRSLEARLGGLNGFVDKDLFERVHAVLESRVQNLENRGNSSAGERGLFRYLWGGAMIVLG